MALTLPYPNMNFVPLDVLTAAEQNQLVANIEYIANQFPVKSSNIDWTTLGSIAYRPGDSVQSVYPTWGFITVDDDPTRARLFIPLAKVPKASVVTFSGSAGNASYGFVVDSNGTNHFVQLAAYQSATGAVTYQGIYLQVSLISSAGATYATGVLTLNEGSLSFS